MKKLVRNLVVSWADKIKYAESERRKRRDTEREEAQAFIIERITGGRCIHARDRDKRLTYCCECPIGSFNGELSHGASAYVCTRRRHYSK